MKNLTWIAKWIIVFIVAITVVDLAAVGYTYFVVSSALDDTLNSISLVVAEENCLDTNPDGDFADSQYYQILDLMAANCPLWLTYNGHGISRIDYGDGTYGYAAGEPTSLEQTASGVTLSSAIGNIYTAENKLYSGSGIGVSALTITCDGMADNACYSYASCPQRGHNIKISLTGYYNLRLIWPWAINASDNTGGGWYLNIPITREVTVVGMKFYKGKEE